MIRCCECCSQGLGAGDPNVVGLACDGEDEGDADLAKDTHGDVFAPQAAAEPKEGAPIDVGAVAVEKELKVRGLSVA